MNDTQASERETLDAALAASALAKREKLFKLAQGRTFRWTDGVILVIACLLFFNGLLGQDGELDRGAAQIAFAFFLIGLVVAVRAESRMNAICELLRK